MGALLGLITVIFIFNIHGSDTPGSINGLFIMAFLTLFTGPIFGDFIGNQELGIYIIGTVEFILLGFLAGYLIENLIKK